MRQNLRLLGWLDPDRPAVQKEAGQHEFRIKLSEVPSALWKKTFVEMGKDQYPRASVEQEVMVLSCELSEIESAIDRIRQRLRQVNETLARQEREVDERLAHQLREDDERRAKILIAVKGIRFDEP
jgi:septal ring factor EnvC (AmiA/AmiB activator)